MPVPHTGVDQANPNTKLWTFDTTGDLVVAGNVYVDGVPDSSNLGPNQTLVPGVQLATVAELGLVYPSGDTSGKTDLASINAVLAKGSNQAVNLSAGDFYVNSTVNYTAHQQWIRGSGFNTTHLIATANFTPNPSAPENCIVYTGIGNQFCGLSDISIEGPSTGSYALGGANQLNGIEQDGQALYFKVINVHGYHLNGYGFEFPGTNGNNTGMLLQNVLIDTSAAIWRLQGNVGGYLGSGTMMNVGGTSIGTGTGAAANLSAALLSDYEDLLSWAAVPTVIQGECASCFFYCIDVGGNSAAPEILIQAGTNGSPTDILLHGGIVQSAEIGIQVTGGNQIHLSHLHIFENRTHGISIESNNGGNGVIIDHCLFQGNGNGAATTVASGSNGGEISQIATWSSPSAGVLDVASSSSFSSSGGTAYVAASGSTTAVITYTGTAAGQLTGCAYVSGSATGTVATGNVVSGYSNLARYDLNWSGTILGSVDDCQFTTAIAAEGSSGVQASVGGLALGQGVVFSNNIYQSTQFATLPLFASGFNSAVFSYESGGPPAGALWTPADETMIAWNYGPETISGSTAMATAGVLYVLAVKIIRQISITNIVMDYATVGNTLASGECYAGLWQGKGGALIGLTADQSSNWVATANTVLTMPLSGGPYTVQPGIVYVGLWFNGTTGPAFRRGNNSVSMNAGLAATSARFGIASGSYTNAASAPSTLTTISDSTNIPWWVALS